MKVWYVLSVDGNDQGVDKVNLEEGADVADFRDAVHAKSTGILSRNKFSEVAASDLKVYENKDDVVSLSASHEVKENAENTSYYVNIDPAVVQQIRAARPPSAVGNGGDMFDMSILQNAFEPMLHPITEGQALIRNELSEFKDELSEFKAQVASSSSFVGSTRKTTEKVIDSMNTALQSADLFSRVLCPITEETMTEIWKQLYDAFDHILNNESINTCSDLILRDVKLPEGKKGTQKAEKVYANLRTAIDVLLREAEFTDEGLVQVLHDFVHSFCAASLKEQAKHVIRATSDWNAPTNPHHKLDVSFVPVGCNSAAFGSKVYWKDVTVAGQLKSSFSTTLLDAVHVQIHDDLHEVLNQQLSRSTAFGITACARRVEFWMAERMPFQMKQSGMMDFLRVRNSQCSEGFKMFLRFLVTPPQLLGFVAPRPVVSLDKVRLPQNLSELLDPDSHPVVIRCGTSFKPDVYECQLRKGSFAALKVFKHRASFESEMLVYASTQTKKRVLTHRTNLLCSSWLEDEQCGVLLAGPFAMNSLASQPFSKHVFADACKSAGDTLKELHSRKLFYIDPSPSNALIYEKGDGSVGCVWNDFGEVKPHHDAKLSGFTGTHVYASLNLAVLATVGDSRSYTFTPIDDYQAVFFTLLQYAFPSRLLPWDSGDISQVSDIWSRKQAICLNTQHMLNSVLNGVYPEASDTLSALYDAVFIDPNVETAYNVLCGVQDDVTDVAVWQGNAVFHVIESCGGYTCAGQVPLSRAVDVLKLRECKRCSTTE